MGLAQPTVCYNTRKNTVFTGKMSEQKLSGNDLTIDWLVDSLKKSATGEKSKSAVLRDWKDGLIAAGDGFMSYIIRVELTWNTEDSGLPNLVVIKVEISFSQNPVFCFVG